MAGRIGRKIRETKKRVLRPIRRLLLQRGIRRDIRGLEDRKQRADEARQDAIHSRQFARQQLENMALHGEPIDSPSVRLTVMNLARQVRSGGANQVRAAEESIRLRNAAERRQHWLDQLKKKSLPRFGRKKTD